MKLKHFDNDGRARFITFCTHQRIPVLTNDRFRIAAVDAIDNSRKTFGFQLIAYVIMPEHVHLVMLPGTGMQMGPVIGEIKRNASRNIHVLLGQRSPLCKKLSVVRNGKVRFALWQRRCFDHNCRSDESLIEIIRYCHENPVKRGLVRHPGDWRWSSCLWYQGRREVVLCMDWPP